MKEGYVKEFFLRGMMFGGFGPIVYGLVYLILQLTFSGTEVFIGIISTYFLAFVHGGASVISEFYHWPIAKKFFVHILVLCASYGLCDIINAWETSFFVIFILIFSAVNALVSITFAICIKILGNRLNKSLK